MNSPLFNSMEPPPNSARLRAGPIPPGASDIYRERYQKAMSRMCVACIFITPAQAAYILESLNTHNRRLGPSWLKIKQAVLRGAWYINGECVAFDCNGVLINGQHRLKAIVESGQPVPVMVFFGVDPEAFTTYDQGKKRNAGDILSIEKREHSSLLAGALAWQMRYENGEFEATCATPIPNDQVLEILNNHPDIVGSAKRVVSKWKTKRLPPSLLVFLHYQFQLIDAPLAETFFDTIVEGLGLVRESHEFLLIRRLDDLIGRRSTVDQVEIAALVIITWNRIRAGAAPPSGRSLLLWKRNIQKFPEIQ